MRPKTRHPELIEPIASMYNDGYPMSDIMRAFNVGKKVVVNILNLKGIQIDPSRKRKLLTQQEKNNVSHKQCSKCKEWWLIFEFRIKKTCYDGHDSICIRCRSKMDKTRNPAQKAATHRAWRAKNPIKKIYTQEELKERAFRKKISRRANPEKDRQIRKRFYEKHRERILIETAESKRQYYHRNKEKVLAQQKIYLNKKRKDPNFALEQRLVRLVRDYVKYDRKSDFLTETLGCSIQYCRKYLENLFSNGMTWETCGQYGWHIDHKIPRAAFDLTDPEQQKACFHYTNLQPLWAKDNLSKQDKIFIDGKLQSCRFLKRKFKLKTLVTISSGIPQLISSLPLPDQKAA